MQRKDIRIRSREGKEFDCYLVTPEAAGQVPAIVLAAAVHGVVFEMLRALLSSALAHAARQQA